MKLTYQPYSLQLEYPFRISKNMRSETPIILTKITHKGYTGYGEASLPPYLEETQQSVISFLEKINLKQFKNSIEIAEIMQYIVAIERGNTAAKASVDIALHDLSGKINNMPCSKIVGINSTKYPPCCFTIGIDEPHIIRKKLEKSHDFELIKIKLDGISDKQMVETVRQFTNKPICADANEGWNDLNYAIEMSHWLKEQGTIFIEQPFSRNSPDKSGMLKEKSPIPIIADESFQGFPDLLNIGDYFDGINVKLMKCAGALSAYHIMQYAKRKGLKILLGCMTESSCGILAAAHLSPLADWTDLDGPFLITNNPFDAPVLKSGSIIPENLPGLGLKRNGKFV